MRQVVPLAITTDGAVGADLPSTGAENGPTSDGHASDREYDEMTRYIGYDAVLGVSLDYTDSREEVNVR